MTKFIAIVSGKGGVGKTTTTINLGHALVQRGKRIILLDANLETPNVAINLGMLNPEGTVNKFLRKEKSLQEIMYLHESGLSVIPASPSYHEFQKTSLQKIGKIFESLNNTADIILVDAPSGLGYEVSEVLKHSTEVIIVTMPTISAVTDALKTMQLARQYDNTIAGVVLNMTHKGSHELSHSQVQEMIDLPLLATIRHSTKIRKAMHKHQPLGYLYPRCRETKEFNAIAEYLCFE